MFKEAIWQLHDHPHRLVIVITVTVLIGLLVTWPVVDEYTAQNVRHDELIQEIKSTQGKVAYLAAFEKRFAEQQAQLQLANAEEVGEDQIQDFRSRLVKIVRESGCTMRGIRVGEVASRRWRKDDDPVGKRFGNQASEETDFSLRTQQVSLSVSGKMDRIRALLDEFNEIHRLMHARRFELNRSEDELDELELEMDLLLYSLEKIEGVAA